MNVNLRIKPFTLTVTFLLPLARMWACLNVVSRNVGGLPGIIIDYTNILNLPMDTKIWSSCSLKFLQHNRRMFFKAKFKYE